MIQGGDITKGNGTGGDSIYGGEFADENIGWRDIDKEGLVCMANRGKNTNTSQFFITLGPCPHLNAKHTLFGHIISGQETITRISKADVDKDDKPLKPILIAHCGELERRRSSKKLKDDYGLEDALPAAASTSRGRRKRRRSGSPSRSPSPSRGHTRRSGSRHRRPHRKHRYTRDRSSSRDSSRRPRREEEEEEQKGRRRRSDASPDHNLRGRMRRRSQAHSVVDEEVDGSTGEEGRRGGRKRGQPPSRQSPVEGGGGSPVFRRRRSLPNQYGERGGERGSEREYDRHREGKAGSERLGGGDEGRLGGGGGGGDADWDGDGGGDGIVYKGRGSMKFREQRRW